MKMFRLATRCASVILVISLFPGCVQPEADLVATGSFREPLDRQYGACCYHVDRCDSDYNNFRRFDYTFYRRADFPPPPQNLVYFEYLQNWIIGNCPGIVDSVNWDSLIDRLRAGQSIRYNYSNCLECRIDQATYPGTSCSD